MAETLTRRDRVWIAIALAVLAVSLTVAVGLFPSAFPEATVRFALDRRESQRRAETLLRDQGLDPSGWRHATRFRYDDETKVFLERELGLAGADSSFSGEVRLWRWAHRWFRAGQEEELRVEFATTGELAGFEHRIAEAAPGASLPPDSARAIAEAFLRGRAAVEPAHLTLVGRRAAARSHRTDHTFVWELRGRRWAGAPLRVEVTVQGDRVGALRSRLEVPEAWRRSHAALRGRNQATGALASVVYVLLLLGIAATFVRRVPRRDIRWRPAAGFALAALALVFLAQLNGAGADLFDYDTRQAPEAFLASRALAWIAQGLGTALFVFVLTAGGESVYRGAYPERISLGGLFTRRGLRTREFFLASIVGLALTGFFLAYQAVFYRIAGALGAWAPAEIPYDELLSTGLPWAVVLLVGFSPAVTEEFSTRMFAVPALGRLLRSRLAGLVLAAAIWGFAHAGYPNQPFWIRGAEVGLAGVLVGVVMLRFGILAALVWHYTVDAFYAAYLLLRSGSPYLVVSGALAAGLVLAPLLYALVAGLRARGFDDGAGLRNRDLPAPTEPPPAEPEEIPRIASEPLPARRWGLVLLVSGLLVAGLRLVPAPEWGRLGRCALTAAEARRVGREELRALGAPVESLRTAVRAETRLDGDGARFVAETIGVERARAWIEREIAPRGWEVRLFAPGRAEEWRVSLDAERGRPVGFEHRVAEAEPGDTLAEDAALALALAHWEARGDDASRWELRERRALPRPARRDWSFTWEAVDSTRRVGEGAVRERVGLIGGEVGSRARFLRVPEEWLRQRAARGPFAAVRSVLLGVLALGGLLYAVRALSRDRPPGPIRWRMGFAAAAAVGAAQWAALPLGWPAQLSRYDTSQPWGLFLLESAVLGPFVALIAAFVLGVGLSLLTSLHPTLGPALQGRNRARFAGDAWRAALVVTAALVALARLRLLLHTRLPGAIPEASLAPPPGIDHLWALPAALGESLTNAGIVAVVVGFALFLVQRRGRIRPAGLGLLLVATVALVPASARGAGEILAAWLFLLCVAATGLALARFVLRDNAPAYVLACVAVGAAGPAAELAAHPATRATAVLLVVTLVAGAAWLLRRAESVRR